MPPDSGPSGCCERWISDCLDHEQEIVDGSAATVSEASQALSRCLEALQTLSFFGAGKLIWFRHCTFLGEEKDGGIQGSHRRAGCRRSGSAAGRGGKFPITDIGGKGGQAQVLLQAIPEIGKSGSARWLGSFQIRLGDRG